MAKIFIVSARHWDETDINYNWKSNAVAFKKEDDATLALAFAKLMSAEAEKFEVADGEILFDLYGGRYSSYNTHAVTFEELKKLAGDLFNRKAVKAWFTQAERTLQAGGMPDKLVVRRMLDSDIKITPRRAAEYLL